MLYESSEGVVGVSTHSVCIVRQRRVDIWYILHRYILYSGTVRRENGRKSCRTREAEL